MRPVQSICILTLVMSLFAGGGVYADASDAENTPKRMAPATRKALVNARAAVEGKNYPRARKILSVYLENHADKAPADVYSLLGNAWFLEERPAGARKAYRRGLERYPENASLHQNYAVASYLNENYVQAGDAFVKAYELEMQDRDVGLLFKAGSAYYNAEKYDRARQSLTRLLEKAETVRPQWRRLLVYTCVSLQQWNAAQSALYPLLEAEPGNTDYWKLLAKLHFNQDDHRQAAAALDVAYRIEPPAPSDWGDLADLYLYVNAPLKAADCIRRGYGDNAGVEEYEKLAQAHARALRYEKAATFIDKAIEKAPTAKRYKMRAHFYYKDRRFQEALASFEKAVEQDSKDEWSRLMMGFCAMSVDNYELAHRAFSDAVESEEYGAWAKSALAMVDDVMDARKNAPRHNKIKVSAWDPARPGGTH